MKSQWIIQVLSFKHFRDYYCRLTENFGSNFVFLLVCVYLFLKGFLLSLISLNMLPFFKNVLNVSETKYQIFIIVAWTPWAMKAWMGATSDLYPLFGYFKSSYMLISAVLGTISIFLLAFINIDKQRAHFAPILIFFIMIEVAFIDLLCEGKYTELMRKKIHTKGDAISWVWGCVVVGSLCAASIVGVFTDHFNARYTYWIGFPFAAQIIIPILLGYMPDERVRKEERVFQKKKYLEQRKLFLLAFLMALFALILAIVNMLTGKHVVFIYSVVVSAVLVGSCFLGLPRIVAMANLYLFLQEALYIQIPGALDYWYTADPSCVAGGPYFDLTYYLTFTQIIGALAGIVGIFLFQIEMTKWSFRSCFWVSTGIRVIASFFDLILVRRVNIKFGISDKVAYMFGDALIMNTASMLSNMPAVLLMTRICPPGYESTMYALLAGFQNFGQNVSKAIGVSLIGYLKIDGDSRPCNFTNLPYLILISHFALPLLTIPLTWLLIPNAKISDEINVDGYVKTTRGSESDASLSSVSEIVSEQIEMTIVDETKAFEKEMIEAEKEEFEANAGKSTRS